MNLLSTRLGLLLSAVLMGFSFCFDDLAFLSLFSLVPLFQYFRSLQEQEKTVKAITVFGSFFLFYFTWQLIAGFWLLNLGVLKMLAVLLINAGLFACIQIPTSYLLRKEYNNKNTWLFSFALTWMVFEQIHFDWVFTFPLFNLGTNLLSYPSLTQWYDLLGVQGGTLWCLSINALIFLMLDNFQSEKSMKPIAIAFVGLLTIPSVSSVIKWQNFQEAQESDLKVLTLHPNLDCYDERQHYTPEEAISYYFDILDRVENKSEIDLILWPENAITDLAWVSDITSISANNNVNLIKQKLNAFPNATLLTGAITYDEVNGRTNSVNVNYSKAIESDFLAYNAIAAFSGSSAKMVRTKEKLVPFEETFPIDFVGVDQLLGLWTKVSPLNFFFASSEEWGDQAFYAEQPEIGTLLPLICYESTYPDLTAKFTQRYNPGLITVHLNEGWYNHPTGARLFQKMAQSRAIENRKTIIRSSNRGISDVINSRGEIVEEQSVSAASNLIADVSLSKKTSLFVKYFHSLIGLSCYFFYLLLLGFIAFYIIKDSWVKPKSKVIRPISKKRRTVLNT